jgi:hypothetical protein
MFSCRASASSDRQGGLRHGAMRRRPAEMPRPGQGPQISQLLRTRKRGTFNPLDPLRFRIVRWSDRADSDRLRHFIHDFAEPQV